MKWFQHLTDSHNNPKTRNLIRQFGCEGYGFLCICREIIGKYGEKYRLKPEKDWKNLLIEATKMDEEKIDDILKFLATNKDIDCKALEMGDLYIPKLREYGDEYTKRLRRESDQAPNKVVLHYITLQDITRHYITVRCLDEKTLSKDDYGRYGKAIKNLFVRAKEDVVLVKEAITWQSKQGYDWTLETVLKKFPDFLRSKNPEVAAKSLAERLGLDD